MKRAYPLSFVLASFVCAAQFVSAQAPAQQSSPAPAGASQAKPAAKQPLQLQSLDPSSHPDPFPPVNLKYFTASTPTVETVDSFLKALWGYDPDRIWRVEAIQTTQAPGVSKVVVYVTDKKPNAKVASAAFFVMPDGKHAIADATAVIPFGATPFADARKTLQERADGAYRGAASKDLLLVEFADLQCPHCAAAQATMDRIVQDFPNARVVFQSFPLTEIHPYAFKAAAYGYCVEKQKNGAFFPFATEVFAKQTALTSDTGDQTLKDAVTKAGLDPNAIDACAASADTKKEVDASTKLAQDLGVDQTPMLAINGRMLPLTSNVPYETLKTIISYQASQDGVSTGAAPVSLRSAPSLTK
ncbi:DsbA family protein [Edaphobacter albus]|uniref:DsbA family protein n=1 Tax=Edaphobacter sp. 4G125 TaxID=2763071 RepID=UPI0021071C98|nr:thioredoxin domain-containing protein [Edaphobacter sp. 4G125]